MKLFGPTAVLTEMATLIMSENIPAGLDVNLHTPDMVYPYNPTAVTVAAQNNDLKMVQL